MQAFKKIVVGLVMCLSMEQVMAVESTTYTEDKPVVRVEAKSPQFSIRLKSNPTTGYSWYLRSYDSNVMQPVKQVYEPPVNKKLIGAPGYEVWTFRVKPAGFVVPMQTVIRFVYARAWEVNGQAKQVVFQVTTSRE